MGQLTGFTFSLSLALSALSFSAAAAPSVFDPQSCSGRQVSHWQVAANLPLALFLPQPVSDLKFRQRSRVCSAFGCKAWKHLDLMQERLRTGEPLGARLSSLALAFYLRSLTPEVGVAFLFGDELGLPSNAFTSGDLLLRGLQQSGYQPALEFSEPDKVGAVSVPSILAAGASGKLTSSCFHIRSQSVSPPNNYGERVEFEFALTGDYSF